MKVSQSDKLAVLGGTPVSSSPLQPPHWPPVSQDTARRLGELYLSRQWAHNPPAEQEFSRAFADYHGAKHGIFMANGTVTLQCALAACGIGSGDEVIVPALTWMATALAAHYVGATPVFVDIDPDTLCLDAAKVEAAITDRTRAIIPVHLYGSMVDLEAMLAVADRHGLVVIEDCAHMHGGKWDGRGVGSWGCVGSFSFQLSKTLSSGEGGICITDDDELAECMFRQKHIGYAAGDLQGQATSGPPEGLVCHNFRATAFQALILNDQLKELDGLIARYNANADRLASRLADVAGLRIQSRGRLAGPQGYYAWVWILDRQPLADVPLRRFIEAAAAEGLGIWGTYGPVYDHMLFNLPASAYRIADGRCPVAENAGTSRALMLLHHWLGADEKTIDTIGEIIAKVAANAKALAGQS